MPENWVKIGLVVQITGLTESLKKLKPKMKKKHEHFIRPPSAALLAAGWAN